MKKKYIKERDAKTIEEKRFEKGWYNERSEERDERQSLNFRNIETVVRVLSSFRFSAFFLRFNFNLFFNFVFRSAPQSTLAHTLSKVNSLFLLFLSNCRWRGTFWLRSSAVASVRWGLVANLGRPMGMIVEFESGSMVVEAHWIMFGGKKGKIVII